jgi:hypothetical protein
MASNQPLVDRTEAVYRELRSMRLRFRLGAWITLIVGGLLLMLVTVYFSYGYSEVSSFRDPELIVSLVGDMAEQQIPTMRKMAQDQVDQNATAWAEMASEQVLTQVRPIREQIETLALQQSDEAIAKINVIGEQKFREILAQNRDTVQDAIDQLKDDQDVSEGAVIALQEAIEKEFLIDADSQVDALVTIVSDINVNMDELVAGENLSREQRAERRVLMLARRLHVDRFGDMSVKDISDSIAPSVVGDLVEEAETRRLQDQAKEASADAADEMAALDTTVAEKPEEKKEAPAEEKPADKSKEEAKPAEKADAPAKEAKPEEKKEAPAKEKPADEPKEEAKPAEKPEAPAKEEAKPAEKPEEKKEAS